MREPRGSGNSVELPAALTGELGRVLVVGVGNELRGDDAAGLEVARQVARAGACAVVIAEDVPENHLGPMQEAGADTVIFCDAVQMGALPGTVAVFALEQLAGGAVSTHNASLRLLGRCLRAAGVRRVLVAGIQPKCLQWGGEMSAEVRAACAELAGMIQKALQR